MYSYFTFKKASPLEQETWRFWLNDRLTLVLDYYERAERPTKRHGFRASDIWSRLSYERRSTISERPVAPDEVRKAIMADVLSKIHFE